MTSRAAALGAFALRVFAGLDRTTPRKCAVREERAPSRPPGCGHDGAWPFNRCSHDGAWPFRVT